MNILFASLLALTQPSAPNDVETPTADAVAEGPRDNYILSARGPATGHYVLGMGGSLLLVVPLLDVRWVHGVSDLLQTDLQFKTIGMFNQLEARVRVRLIESEALSVALRGGGLLNHLYAGDDVQGLWLGVGAGAIASFGTEALQWTVSLEGRAGQTFEVGLVPMLDASVGVEFPVADTRNMFIELRALTSFTDTNGARTLPLLSLGVAW